MPYLSPPTLTRMEQETLLRVSSEHPRDHLIFSLALGTGLRLSEIVGLNVGDMFLPDGYAKFGQSKRVGARASAVMDDRWGNSRRGRDVGHRAPGGASIYT